MKDLIPVWKPTNMTSYDVIRKIQSINSEIKVGHCGTLDPFASGVLLLCFGKNTKNISKFMLLNKVYHATINLNEETDTLDLTGKTIKKKNKSIKITKKNIEKSILELTGINTSQIPPYFSAKKFHGLKMYEYARNDIFIRRKPSLVNIHSISLKGYSDTAIKIKVNCGKGVYIRSIARDLAYKLKTYGYLKELVRSEIGDYNISNCYQIEDLPNVCS